MRRRSNVDIRSSRCTASNKGRGGLNPHKPGRRSHACHSYQISGLEIDARSRCVAGNQSHVNHTLPGLVEGCESLPLEKRPKLVRGDAGLASE